MATERICEICGDDLACYGYTYCSDCMEGTAMYFDPGPRSLEPRYTLAELDEIISRLAADLLLMHDEEAINLGQWEAAAKLVSAAGYDAPGDNGV